MSRAGAERRHDLVARRGHKNRRQGRIDAAHQRFGKLPFKRLFDAALVIAEDGVTVDADLALWIQERKDILGRLPDARRVFTKPDGRFYASGDRFRQRDLARTLRLVARDGAALTDRVSRLARARITGSDEVTAGSGRLPT